MTPATQKISASGAMPTKRFLRVIMLIPEAHRA
jgi:hypothetical protein